MTTKRHKRAGTLSLRDLVAWLEAERSALPCVRLAHALGYEITGRAGRVGVRKPARRRVVWYASADAFMDALLHDARQVLERERGSRR